MKSFKRVVAFILLISIIVTLAACNPKPSESDELDKSEDPTAPVATQKTGKITITDAIGREIVLDEPAQKAVGTHNPSFNSVVVLGGGDKYIAGFDGSMCRGLYSLVMDNCEGITEIGKKKSINYETVLAVGADLAIIPERFKELIEEFEQVGIPVIVAAPNDESFDTVKNTISIVGKALGENEHAEKINDFFDRKVAETKAIATKSTDKQKVLFLGGSSQLSVAPSAMIQTQLIEAAGGINAVAEIDVKGAFADVSIEQIIAWDPDVIWFPGYADYTVEGLLSDPAWSNISAIKNKAVHRFPCLLESWDEPTIAVSLGICWATYNLHPDLYTLDDLKKDADEFYNLIYGKTFTLEEMGLK